MRDWSSTRVVHLLKHMIASLGVDFSNSDLSHVRDSGDSARWPITNTTCNTRCRTRCSNYKIDSTWESNSTKFNLVFTSAAPANILYKVLLKDIESKYQLSFVVEVRAVG